MTVLRRTSVYQVDFPGADSRALDAAIARCPADVELAGSAAPRGSSAFVRVRVPSDAHAAAVATEMAQGREFRIRTGYGVNQRVVEARPPAGCFCRIMDRPRACLTCTCPDCGGVGRFGIPIVHSPHCA